MNNFSTLQSRVRQDLLGKVEGRFTSGEETEIMRVARAKWETELLSTSEPEAAWSRVAEDFHSGDHWGFDAKPVPLASEREGTTLGVQLILLTFVTGTFGLIALVWLGQNFTNTGATKDLLLLLLAVGSLIALYAAFLWRHARH